MLKNKIDKLDLKGQNRRSSATSGPVRDRAGEVSALAQRRRRKAEKLERLRKQRAAREEALSKRAQSESLEQSERERRKQEAEAKLEAARQKREEKRAQQEEAERAATERRASQLAHADAARKKLEEERRAIEQAEQAKEEDARRAEATREARRARAEAKAKEIEEARAREIPLAKPRLVESDDEGAEVEDAEREREDDEVEAAREAQTVRGKRRGVYDDMEDEGPVDLDESRAARERSQQARAAPAKSLRRSKSQDSMGVSLYSEADRIKLQMGGRKNGPLWMINHLFPSAVRDASMDALNKPVPDGEEEDEEEERMTVSELASRIYWKAKVLHHDEWWSRFSHVMLSVVNFVNFHLHEDTERMRVTLEALVLWLQRIVQDQPLRLYKFFQPSGEFGTHIDAFIERVPAAGDILKQLIRQYGLVDEASTRLCPRSDFTTEFLCDILLDEDDDLHTRTMAGLALGPQADFTHPYLSLMNRLITEEEGGPNSIPPQVRWSVTKSLLEQWQATGQLDARIKSNDSSGRTMLSWAALDGNTRMVVLLLQAQAVVDVADRQQCTPLLLAAMHGHDRALVPLIKARANVHHRDKDGMTALMHAARRGHGKCVKVLAQARAKIEERDKKGRTPLMAAAVHGKAGAISALIDAGADMEIKDAKGRTPLLMAAASGVGAAVNVLLAKGADYNHRDHSGMNALMLATERSYLEVMESLLIVMGRNECLGRYNPVNELGENRMTALMIASAAGNTPAAMLLLEYNASAQVKDSVNMEMGHTCVEYARQNGHRELAKKLEAELRRQEALEEEALNEPYEFGMPDPDREFSFSGLVEYMWKRDDVQA